IMQQLVAREGSASILIGLATFPHDGRDLSQLLRVARYRAEASERSVAQRQDLWRLPMSELLDAVLWDARDDGTAFDSPRAIELPVRDVLAVASTAVQEATRSGATWLLASHRNGLGIGTAVR